MLVASGDNGLSSTIGVCDFIPCVISSSPWVTSVGATMRSRTAAPFCSNPEYANVLGSCEEEGVVGCSPAVGALFTTSGFWSLYRAMPSYQERAVRRCLGGEAVDCAPCSTAVSAASPSWDLQVVAGSPGGTDHVRNYTMPCPHLAPSGDASRGFRCPLKPLLHARRDAPDLALPGHFFPTVANGSVLASDGTSAAAPAFAALVSLLNAEQARRGRPSLGFLNPWLYQVQRRAPEAFQDVLVGNSSFTEDLRCPFGYRAAPWWGPLSGLGQPDFLALVRHLPERGGRRQQESGEGNSSPSSSSSSSSAHVGRRRGPRPFGEEGHSTERASRYEKAGDREEEVSESGVGIPVGSAKESRAGSTSAELGWLREEEVLHGVAESPGRHQGPRKGFATSPMPSFVGRCFGDLVAWLGPPLAVALPVALICKSAAARVNSLSCSSFFRRRRLGGAAGVRLLEEEDRETANY